MAGPTRTQTNPTDAARDSTVPHRRGRPAPGLAIALGLLAAVLVAELAAILWLNRGVFVYSFDDAYVHLALAERLAGGHYGINPGEPASPSSSIAWPLLLVPLARTAVGGWVPLLLNVAAAFALVIVVHRVVALAFDDASEMKRGSIVAALMVGMNVPFLVFTGMEHTLHVLLTALVVLGMVMESRGGRMPPWLPAAAMAGVMVRYEGLAIAVAAAIYLAARGHRGRAAVTALVAALPIAAFTLFLHARGLPLLPASILSKGGSLAAHPGPEGIARLAWANFGTVAGRTLWVALLLIAMAALGRRARADRLLAASPAVALGLALALVPIIGYGRYEAFAWCIAALGAVYAWRAPLGQVVNSASTVRVALASVALVAVLAPRFVATALVTPRASNNIYLQHVQMHRFATEWWRGPVAVNDLGRVAWRNLNYVLDLWGLGSPAALQARQRGGDPEWMDALARRRGVRLAMLYPHWFPTVPAGWTRVATLRFDGPRRTPDGRDVAIYATDASSAARAQRLLPAFARTLPPGARLVWPSE
jgi:hypothetical protein